MVIGIPREKREGETRVALVPSAVAPLKKKGHAVLVESGAGLAAFIADEDFTKAGADVVARADDVYAGSDIVFKVQSPDGDGGAAGHEAETLREGTTLISFLNPFANADTLRILLRRSVTSFAMELVPRITRAQSMDALSSMATLAGYKAVLVAADRLHRMFPLLSTAAGTVAPSTMLVLGAGVAGLQAIATGKRLGARVEAFDPRAVVREQVESVGALFVPMEVTEEVQTAGGYAKEQSEDFLQRERDVIAARLPKCDVVITTAQVFGKTPPLLITEEMVKLMAPGSVIVDLAAEQGGNCALTETGVTVERHGVTICGETNLPARLPINASQMYSKNISTLFEHLYRDPAKGLDFEDEITRSTCLTHAGEICNKSVRDALNGVLTGS